jgi:hypothetical protein
MNNAFLTRYALLLALLPVSQAQAAVPGQSSDHLDQRLMPIAAAAAQHVDGVLRDAALLRQQDHRSSPFETRWNTAGQVQVYLHYDPSQAAPDQEQLAALGVTEMVVSAKLGVIQGWVPASQLEAVASLPGVARVGLPRYAVPAQAPVPGPRYATGSLDTEGDTLLGASAFRKSTGVTGQGVTVGVISDGDQHVADSQKSGNLPGNIWNDPKNAGGSGGFSPASAGDEGTAMMEIVYDLAPGVSRLGFCGPQTTVDFVTCLDDFKSNISANVIVDDLGFPGGAMFSHDSFTSAIASFASENPSIRLVTAAGNDGTSFWQGNWTPLTVSTTVNGISYDKAQAFINSNHVAKPYLRLFVPSGDTVGYIVEWADPWDDAAIANDPNDYDVVVFNNPNSDPTGAVACNQGINIGPANGGTKCNQANTKPTNTPGPTPVQGSEWRATQTDYYLEVFFRHGTPSKRIKILVFDQQSRQVLVEPSTIGSINGQAALAYPVEITAGAVNAGDLSLESFSSTGPVQTGTTGQVQRNIMKPDFVAPDCVKVTGAGGFPTPFCGTSAAAPHIAGLVALLMSGYPGQSPYTLLQQSATPKGGSVPNGQYGYGLPNMQTLLKKGLKPTPKPSSGGGGGDLELLALLVLGLLAGAKRKLSS